MDLTLNLSHILLAIFGGTFTFLLNRVVSSGEKRDVAMAEALKEIVGRLNVHGTKIAVMEPNVNSLLNLTAEHSKKLGAHDTALAVLTAEKV